MEATRRPSCVRRNRWPGLAAGLSLLLASCAASLIARNDPQTETMTTALQTAVDAHFTALGKEEAPACFHDAHQAFYMQEQADVSALEQRVTRLPKNTATIDQVRGLKRSLEDFETLHKRASARSRCMSPAELQPARSGIDTSLASILALERRKPPATGAPQ